MHSELGYKLLKAEQASLEKHIIWSLSRWRIYGDIDDFKKAIKEKNGDKLLKIFASTKNVRKEIIKAGQDVKSPDFGRKKN